MAVVSKKELADSLAEVVGTKTKANDVVNALFAEITNQLKKGNEVDIYGFGKFEVRARAAREGVNPLTKQKIKIAATKVPAFKAKKALKDSVK